MEKVNDKIEGTLVLDGLVQGGGIYDPEIKNKLQEWEKVSYQRGFPFTLECSDASFSVLPDKDPVKTGDIKGDPTDAITRLLDELLAVLPDEIRSSVFSTVRSTEYRENIEVQTLYALGLDGSIHTEQRIQEAETVKPIVPISKKEKIRLGIIAAVVVAVAGTLIYLFAPVNDLFRTTAAKVAEDLQLSDDQVKEYVVMKAVEASEGSKTKLKIQVDRGNRYPVDDKDLEKMGTEGTLLDRLVAEDISRGRMRFQWLGADDKDLGSGYIDISGLREQVTIWRVLDLPGGKNAKPVKLKLCL